MNTRLCKTHRPPNVVCGNQESKYKVTRSKVKFNANENVTRSQTVARIADRKASQQSVVISLAIAAK